MLAAKSLQTYSLGIQISWIVAFKSFLIITKRVFIDCVVVNTAITRQIQFELFSFQEVRFREASSLYYIFLQKALLNQVSLEVTKAGVPDNKQRLVVNCLTQVQNIKAENGFCFTNSVHVWEAPMIMIAYSNEL